MKYVLYKKIQKAIDGTYAYLKIVNWLNLSQCLFPISSIYMLSL